MDGEVRVWGKVSIWENSGNSQCIKTHTLKTVIVFNKGNRFFQYFTKDIISKWKQRSLKSKKYKKKESLLL